MKKNKIGLMVIIFAVIGFLAFNVWAGEFICSVAEVGQGNPSKYVRLTDTDGTPAFVDCWFKLPADRGNEMLAVALTALTSGLNVHVWCSGTQYSEIWNMYLTTD